jgi:hypothetical protein
MKFLWKMLTVQYWLLRSLIYCDMTPEWRNRLLLDNGSVSTFRCNGYACKSQSVATGLSHVSWQRIKQSNTRTVGGNDPRQTGRLTVGRNIRLRLSRRSSCVEEGSNTFTVALRVVGGNEKGSLEFETAKYGCESHRTRIREWLHWRCPTAIVNDRPVFSSERAPHVNKPATLWQ